jgi:hypothetical protein
VVPAFCSGTELEAGVFSALGATVCSGTGLVAEVGAGEGVESGSGGGTGSGSMLIGAAASLFGAVGAGEGDTEGSGAGLEPGVPSGCDAADFCSGAEFEAGFGAGVVVVVGAAFVSEAVTGSVTTGFPVAAISAPRPPRRPPEGRCGGGGISRLPSTRL